MRNINLQLFALTLSTKTSIVDYLKSKGQDSSYANRKKLAGQYGISNYTGTADQNTKLLQMMQNASSASASSTSKKNTSNKTNSTASAVKNSVADKVLDFAASAKKNSAGSGTVVKDAADLLEQRMEQTFASSPAVSTPLVSEYIPKAETPQTKPVEMPTVSAPQFKPVEMPTYNPQTNANVPNYTPVEMPTYNPTTQPAQQATPLKDRLDQATLDKLNSQFVVSDAYNKAMEYTNGLLQNLNSGRTQYTDQISQLIKDFQSREKFSYDAATDPLFQQMLGSAMQSGNLAMQDTMGQAAALTGGYGSSYSQAVGNNAYNQYLQEAYNNLPEYYQLAMDAYNMEGQDMLNQISLLDAADSKEYDRMFNAWNTNYQNAQDMYNKEYGAWRDSVADAYNYAGLQNDDYWNNLEYNESIRQNEQNFQYQQYLDQLKQSQWQNEFNYQQYLDQMNQANADRDFQYQQYRDQVAQNQWQNEFNYGQYMDQIAQNQWKDEFDYQKEQDKAAQDRWQNEFDYEKEQDKQTQTNYENEFNYQKEQDKQSQSNWEQQFEYGKEQDALSQSNWEKQFAQDVIEFDKSFAEEQRQFDQSLREDQRQYDTSMKFNKDQAKEEQYRWEREMAIKESQAKAEEAGEEYEYKAPSEKMFTAGMEAALRGGEAAVVAYCDTISEYDGFAIVDYCQKKLTFKKTKDTANGLFGLDHNDVFVDGYGQTYTLDEIEETLGLPKAQLKQLTKIKEGETLDLFTNLE